MTQLSYGAYAAGTNGTAQQTLVSRSRNNGVATAKAYTLTVDTATDDTAYTVDLTFPGQVTAITISFTSGTGTTLTLIRDGLQAAWDSEALATGRALAADNSTDALDFTAIALGVDFTLANASSLMTLGTATGGGTPDLIPFGRFVADTVAGTTCEEALLAGFTANVVSVTPSAEVDLTIYTITVNIPNYGDTGYTAQYLSVNSGDVGRVVDGLVITLNAVLPNGIVIASNSGDAVFLTAGLPGYGMVVTAGVSDHGTSDPSMTITTETFGTDINLSIAGLATYSAEFAASTNDAGEVGYPGFGDVNVLTQGTVIVNTLTEVTVGNWVWYCFGTSTPGGFSDQSLGGLTPPATGWDDWRVLLPSQYKWVKALSSTQAILSIDLGA